MSPNSHDQVITISRRVSRSCDVCVKGRRYCSVELVDLVGKVISIDIWPDDSLTLLASHGARHFQIHAIEG